MSGEGSETKGAGRLRERVRTGGALSWKRTGLAAGSILALVLLLFYLEGTIGGGKVEPGNVPLDRGLPVPSLRTAPVEEREIEEDLEWPGTVRSRTVVQVAAKIMARALEVRAEVGRPVQAGEILAILEGREIQARLNQARSALHAAQAQAAQAQAEYARIKGLYEKQAATSRDLEGAEARAKAAQAQVDQAGHAVREAEVMEAETLVRAPLDAVVVEKGIQAGDLAIPGKCLFVLQDPVRLRLEAQVPETFASKTVLGMEVRVRFDALGREVPARIEEISPVADPQSRTLLVKAALPHEKDLRPGMFGRLLQPWGKKVALLIPSSAVIRSGQLEMVQVTEGGEVRLRHVRTGKTYGSQVEVLSGLRSGERVRVP